MSKDKSDDTANTKKGKALVLKLLAGVSLLAAGGGGAFALVQAGVLPAIGSAKTDNRPKLVRKDEPPHLRRARKARPPLIFRGMAAAPTAPAISALPTNSHQT